ncbi:MAG: hypothetical protein WBN23_05270 [Woeseia sp.]
MMKKLSTAALCAILLGSAALAQQQESKIELAINDGQGDDLVIRINGKDQDLDLHKLQLGESRSVNTVDGRPVLITRVADGYTFDVDGRQITMPMADHEAGVGHREVRVMRHVGAGPGPHPDGVTILSPGPLDDATRASITSTLAAAGMTEVRFIDTADMGPGSQTMHAPLPPGATRELRVIRKEVDVTN